MAAKASVFSLLAFTITIFIILSLHLVTCIRSPIKLSNQTLFNDLRIQSSNALPPNSSSSPSPSPSPPLVPAFFVIGDSTVDCGNNNFLQTFASADHPPYGRDFDTHEPTGRFCNGRTPVDFLALRLGLPFVPSYLQVAGNVEAMIQGVNYASAAAGIISYTGSDVGQRCSLLQQIQQLDDTFQLFKMSMGEDAALSLISKSMFYISIGTNDYIHNYLVNASGIQILYTPWDFSRFLTTSLTQQIKHLYTTNARKIVLMGLPPIGCSPYYLWHYKSNDGECIHKINNMIMEFNFAMRYMVKQLNEELHDAQIIFCDVYQGATDLLENYRHYGFNVTTDACCGSGQYKGEILCLSPEMACHNASDHIWWDQFHPTDVVNRILADNVWSDLHSKMCYPKNMKDMVVTGQGYT